MVHMYIVNPARKLRFLSNVVLKSSSRLLRQTSFGAHAPASSITDFYIVPDTRPQKTDRSNLLDKKLPDVPPECLQRDSRYYSSESDSGCCVFRAENTLFRVHKCYLMREPCAFGDLFSLPSVPGGFVEGHTDDTPVSLSDSAEEFRDLLWALYALPTQLISMDDSDTSSVRRLFNIAKMANKYCMASYESWALDKILTLVHAPMGFLRTAPPELCAHALEVAVLCNHREIIEIICHRLVSRMLWSDVDCRPILAIAEKRGLHKLCGVAYYRALIDPEKASAGPISVKRSSSSHSELEFPLGMTIEQRVSNASAYDSLVTLWDRIRAMPPAFPDHGCTAHEDCLSSWAKMWTSAAAAPQVQRHGRADVLGRLKAMMILLKKNLKQDTSRVSLCCTLSAIESITAARDEIVAGLIHHFHDL
ncbi:hypothetical protein D9619_006937 [Psilocybe cf. subviscida]|uniref:BTB domain-containing protein n=1 Tax=Psilocybe cf. subviscida TaxID=2480587 RepID=A0A8H5B271_9AGAR|nr:hypothetical protein D9619_006937 [Psilocybe cf. subviscida]